jgi:threonine-phosphate decarboxylase
MDTILDFTDELNFLQPHIEIDYNKIDTTKLKKCSYLLKHLEARYKVKSAQIELFNGYDSAIYSLLKFFKLKYCFIYSPCVSLYKNAASNLDYEVRLINRFENLFLPIKEKSVVVFMNPSFLDGTYYNLEKIFLYWINKEATIIIDESLLDFCNEKSSITYITEYSKVYILKDMSKFYSNKSLNIATVFSSIENIKLLKKYEPANKISNFEIKYLEESLNDYKFKVISNSINIKNKLELERIFQNNRYIDFIFNSSSNSLLIKLKDINSNDFKKLLEDNKVKIDSSIEYDFVDDSFINLFVNSQDKIEKLKKILNVI